MQTQIITKLLRYPTIVLIALVTIADAFGQDDFADYDCSYLDETFDIKIHATDSDDSTSYKLYVSAYSLDGFSEDGGIILDHESNLAFQEALDSARRKLMQQNQLN